MFGMTKAQPDASGDPSRLLWEVSAAARDAAETLELGLRVGSVSRNARIQCVLRDVEDACDLLARLARRHSPILPNCASFCASLFEDCAEGLAAQGEPQPRMVALGRVLRDLAVVCRRMGCEAAG